MPGEYTTGAGPKGDDSWGLIEPP